MEDQNEEIKINPKYGVARNIETISWGLFFIWIGIAFMIEVGNAIGLLGVGIITLGAQIIRGFFYLKLEGFWVLVGLCFISGGLWDIFDPGFKLVPILLIVSGSVLIISIRNNSMPDNG